VVLPVSPFSCVCHFLAITLNQAGVSVADQVFAHALFQIVKNSLSIISTKLGDMFVPSQTAVIVSIVPSFIDVA
jgi:hypothetical protein